jgi:hypothetical protein
LLLPLLWQQLHVHVLLMLALPLLLPSLHLELLLLFVFSLSTLGKSLTLVVSALRNIHDCLTVAASGLVQCSSQRLVVVQLMLSTDHNSLGREGGQQVHKQQRRVAVAVSSHRHTRALPQQACAGLAQHIGLGVLANQDHPKACWHMSTGALQQRCGQLS